MKLSRHFTFSEMTRSQTATRLGIRNHPSAEHVEALRHLCAEVLEPVREMVGRPVRISSGYRSAELSERIGSSPRSQHCRGEAADFEVPGISNLVLAHAIAESQIPYDQLILEFHDPLEGPASGWIHISAVRGQPRRMVLTATRQKGQVVYTEGLPYLPEPQDLP